jgi:hypothetical protein
VYGWAGNLRVPTCSQGWHHDDVCRIHRQKSSTKIQAHHSTEDSVNPSQPSSSECLSSVQETDVTLRFHRFIGSFPGRMLEWLDRRNTALKGHRIPFLVTTGNVSSPKAHPRVSWSSAWMSGLWACYEQPLEFIYSIFRNEQFTFLILRVKHFS